MVSSYFDMTLQKKRKWIWFSFHVWLIKETVEEFYNQAPITHFRPTRGGHESLVSDLHIIHYVDRLVKGS